MYNVRSYSLVIRAYYWIIKYLTKDYGTKGLGTQEYLLLMSMYVQLNDRILPYLTYSNHSGVYNL